MTRDLHAGLLFYAIAFGLALLVALAAPLLGPAGELLTMLTPLAAVVATILFATRVGERRAAVAGLGLGRLGLKAWPAALAIPFLIEIGAIALLAAIGLTAIAMPASPSVADVVSNAAAGLVIMTVIAAFEEVGWRGYMLPRMMGLGPVRAMLIVGFLHGLWHMPLLLLTDLYHADGNTWIVVPMFLTTLTLAGVLYGALRVWTGSFWPAAVAHAAVNVAWGVSGEMSTVKSPLVLEYLGGESGLIMIVALLIVDGVLILRMRGRSLTGVAPSRPASLPL